MTPSSQEMESPEIPGRFSLYTLKLGSEGNPTVKAQIFRNGKPVVKSSVTVRPRTNEQSNTIMQDADGTLREIRLKKQVIVFPSTE